MRGIGEQAVAHGAAGRAVLKWKVVRRVPVNGVVNCESSRRHEPDDGRYRIVDCGLGFDYRVRRFCCYGVLSSSSHPAIEVSHPVANNWLRNVFPWSGHPVSCPTLLT